VTGIYWGKSLQMIETFFVREVGRGRGVQERNLEVTEVLRRGGRRWCRREAGLDIFLEEWSGKFMMFLRMRRAELSAAGSAGDGGRATHKERRQQTRHECQRHERLRKRMWRHHLRQQQVATRRQPESLQRRAWRHQWRSFSTYVTVSSSQHSVHRA